MKSQVKLISYTQPVEGLPVDTPEALVAFCARVSSSRDYETRGEDYKGLLDYCKRNAHWSVFSMVDATVEIQAPRDITRQVLRHSSFEFQEFSQRYSSEIDFDYTRVARLQDHKNRQNSINTNDPILGRDFSESVQRVIDTSKFYYERALESGIAKECSRVLLPEGLTMSTLYMKGSLRSWIHYLEVREGNGTQKEHTELAIKIRKELLPIFPKVLG